MLGRVVYFYMAWGKSETAWAILGIINRVVDADAKIVDIHICDVDHHGMSVHSTAYSQASAIGKWNYPEDV